MPSLPMTDPYANIGTTRDRSSVSEPDIKPSESNITSNRRGHSDEAAWKAFNYYVNEENLEPLAAAAIVGNLAVESAGFDPDVISGKRRGDNGTAFYIPQLRGGREEDFHNWAQKNHLDPRSEQAQLAFVRYEAEQRGDLAAVKKAKTVRDAAILFGKRYERPSDKYAQWNLRSDIAQNVYDRFIRSQQDIAAANQKQMTNDFGRFQQGGEYMVTPKQLEFILAHGGEVEFLRS
jgi:hypothetical protein